MNQYPLDLVGVFDRGVPNLERIAIKSTGFVDLRNYFVGLGLRKDANSLDPINDNTFWLGQGFLAPDDWFMIYTGRGQPTSSQVPNQNYSVYTVHWGRNSVLFSSNEIVPYIYTISNVVVPADMRPKIDSPPENEVTQNALSDLAKSFGG